MKTITEAMTETTTERIFYHADSSAALYSGERPFKQPTLWNTISDPTRTIWCWFCSNAQVVKQTYNVLDFMWFRKIGSGLLPDDHPWMTGDIPGTEETVWEKNIIYASPRKGEWKGTPPDEDHVIVKKIGTFLCSMVSRSNVDDPEIPQGKKRRMPHAVNYIHGAIHYNGCFVIFNDFQDALFHLSDRSFRKEFTRCGRKEGREITIVVRERAYHPEDYAWFISFVRSHFIWFANGNGPTKRRVLHGNPSPYPAVNTINGSWIRDMNTLRKGNVEQLIREPIQAAQYFNGSYRGHQSEFAFMDRFHAWMQYRYIEAKRFQGGLVFTRRRNIEPENWKKYLETDKRWRASYSVSHPFMRITTARGRRAERNEATEEPVLPGDGNWEITIKA